MRSLVLSLALFSRPLAPSPRRRRGAIRICKASGRIRRPFRSSGRQRWPTSRSSPKQEAAEVEKNSLASILKFVAGAIPTSGELNGIWLETGEGQSRTQPEDVPGGRSARRQDSVYERRADAMGRDAVARTRTHGPAHGTDKPVDRTLVERCITTGGIFVPNPFYNNYHQIVQAPGYVVILTEMMHEHAGGPS